MPNGFRMLITVSVHTVIKRPRVSKYERTTFQGNIRGGQCKGNVTYNAHANDRKGRCEETVGEGVRAVIG